MKRLGLACLFAIAVPRAGFADAPNPPLTALPPEPPAPEAEKAPAPTPEPTPAPERQPMVRSRDIYIEVPGERSRNNKLIIGGVAGVGVLVSALGLYWHLDSRDAANEVSANMFTGKAWTDHHVALVDRAERSKTRATVAYVIGGGALVGAIVAFIYTAPKSETTVIHTGGVTVAPMSDGGTMVTKLWSF